VSNVGPFRRIPHLYEDADIGSCVQLVSMLEYMEISREHAEHLLQPGVLLTFGKWWKINKYSTVHGDITKFMLIDDLSTRKAKLTFEGSVLLLCWFVFSLRQIVDRHIQKQPAVSYLKTCDAIVNEIAERIIQRIKDCNVLQLLNAACAEKSAPVSPIDKLLSLGKDGVVNEIHRQMSKLFSKTLRVRCSACSRCTYFPRDEARFKDFDLDRFWSLQKWTCQDMTWQSGPTKCGHQSSSDINLVAECNGIDALALVAFESEPANSSSEGGCRKRSREDKLVDKLSDTVEKLEQELLETKRSLSVHAKIISKLQEDVNKNLRVSDLLFEPGSSRVTSADLSGLRFRF
jgi:hypothetical protein